MHNKWAQASEWFDSLFFNFFSSCFIGIVSCWLSFVCACGKTIQQSRFVYIHRKKAPLSNEIIMSFFSIFLIFLVRHMLNVQIDWIFSVYKLIVSEYWTAVDGGGSLKFHFVNFARVKKARISVFLCQTEAIAILNSSTCNFQNKCLSVGLDTFVRFCGVKYVNVDLMWNFFK